MLYHTSPNYLSSQITDNDQLLFQKKKTNDLKEKKDAAKQKLAKVTFACREEMLKLREQKAQVQLEKLTKRKDKIERLIKLEHEIRELNAKTFMRIKPMHNPTTTTLYQNIVNIFYYMMVAIVILGFTYGMTKIAISTFDSLQNNQLTIIAAETNLFKLKEGVSDIFETKKVTTSYSFES
uniref:Uncharacterized protein n=1 Tax=Hedophyllum nigripes TaxID=2724434 RepID=A0A8F0FC53_9PHAE|nr:hypothetical protein [Hedophyllum nigripes]